jgi:hypothetical protein
MCFKNGEMKFKPSLIGLYILLMPTLFLGNANADWKKETSTNFKGEKNTFLVKKAGNGAEIWIDPQQEQIVFQHRGMVLNSLKGIKVDGKYFEDYVGSQGDKMDTLVFCGRSYMPDCYDAILGAKKIELQTDYFRRGEIVNTFFIK